MEESCEAARDIEASTDIGDVMPISTDVDNGTVSSPKSPDMPAVSKVVWPSLSSANECDSTGMGTLLTTATSAFFRAGIEKVGGGAGNALVHARSLSSSGMSISSSRWLIT